GPHGLVGGGHPGNAAIGLEFESGEIVVLEFRAKREIKPLLNQHDFVLEKAAVELQIPAGGQEGQRAAVMDLVDHEPVARAPDEPIPLAEREAMLEIEIVGVEVFGKDTGNSPPRSVPISLKGQVRILGERMCPSAQEVLTIDVD